MKDWKLPLYSDQRGFVERGLFCRTEWDTKENWDMMIDSSWIEKLLNFFWCFDVLELNLVNELRITFVFAFLLYPYPTWLGIYWSCVYVTNLEAQNKHHLLLGIGLQIVKKQDHLRQVLCIWKIRKFIL